MVVVVVRVVMVVVVVVVVVVVMMVRLSTSPERLCPFTSEPKLLFPFSSPDCLSPQEGLFKPESCLMRLYETASART